MKKLMSLSASFIFFATSCSRSVLIDPPIDFETVSQISGFQSTSELNHSVFNVVIPRTNLNVSVNGVKLTPELGMNCSVTLSGTTHHAQLIGDLHLLASEVTPALRSIVDLGIDVTSLHNTSLVESPRVMSLHISAAGTAENLAKKMGVLLKNILTHKLTQDTSSENPIDPHKSTLNPKTMETLLWKGTWSNGVYRISRGRGTQLGNHFMGESEGVYSWAAFTGSEARSVVTGDIATIEPELREVLRTLLQSEIQVVSIHTHLMQEVPKVIFVHFWGMGNIRKLAEGIKRSIEVPEHHQSN